MRFYPGARPTEEKLKLVKIRTEQAQRKKDDEIVNYSGIGKSTGNGLR